MKTNSHNEQSCFPNFHFFADYVVIIFNCQLIEDISFPRWEKQ